MADRAQRLKEIQETAFVMDDLTLYLDTHPLDASALELFGQISTRRKELMAQYAREFEPLSINCVCPDTNNQSDTHTRYPGQKHFTWSDGPLPWDNQSVQGGAQ